MKKLATATLLTACAFSAFANDPQAINPDGENSTAVGRSGVTLAPEVYTISLRAPLIENHTFPVPVRYFDALLKPGSRLSAVLNVPLTLQVENSRARRLLTLLSLNGDEELPYGQHLKSLKQISLQTMKDTTSGNVVLEQFVGPNKYIFRSIEDGANFAVDFILPINHKHFHNGFVKVAIGSTNGVELDTPCEVTSTNCATPVVFRVIPRHVVYNETLAATSEYRKITPETTHTVESSNVDLELWVNGEKTDIIVDRKQLPTSMEGQYVQWEFDLHRYLRTQVETYFYHVDFYPVIHYMSNDSYRVGDVLASTVATTSPDLYTHNDNVSEPVLQRLEELDTVAPFDGSTAPQATAEQ